MFGQGVWIMRNGYSKDKSAFTLIELLVVISIIALLLSILMPALSKVKEKGKQVVCASQMRQWVIACNTFAASNDDAIPYAAADLGSSVYAGWWFDELAPYLSDKTDTDTSDDIGNPYYSSVITENWYLKVRWCPSSRKRSQDRYETLEQMNIDIGKGDKCSYAVNFGWYPIRSAPKLVAPFRYGKFGSETAPPMKLSKIRSPGSVMAFSETNGGAVIVNPLEPHFGPFLWVYDTDGDGDGDSRWDGVNEYSGFKPKIHSDGSNVALMDGHVEYVKFKKLWAVDDTTATIPTHPFWKMKR